MKEKWTCPNMDVQVFTPQNYCSSCWDVTLDCVGQSSSQGHNTADVYPWGTHDKHSADPIGTIHYQNHIAHSTPIISVRVPGDESFDPNKINEYTIVGGFSTTTEVGMGGSRSGQDWNPGYYWYTGADIHFATSLNYQQNQTRPNHS